MEHFLPKGEREPDTAYLKRLDAARPSGFFRDALRNGAALLLVLPPEHSWPSECHRQEALRRVDRLSLPRLQRVPRANCLNCELPFSCSLPGRIVWREPENRPQPKQLSCSARGDITRG